MLLLGRFENLRADLDEAFFTCQWYSWDVFSVLSVAVVWNPCVGTQSKEMDK